VIELTFDPIVGEAVRIRGEAGGTQEFTSIVELEAYGGLGVPGDADEDGDVDRRDFLLLREHFGGEPAGWPDGDFNFDGKLDFRDYLALKSNLHATGGTERTPEPATALLLFALTPFLVKRRRARAEPPSPLTP